jgi:hypothetical protein
MKSKVKRTFTGKSNYHRFDIAVGQIETAIRLFLTDGCDMFSAIALASNAGELFHSLVVRAKKTPYIDDIVKAGSIENPGQPTPPRYKMISHVHEVIFANEMKHFDEKKPEIIEFDAEECATAAILKAIADYQTLTGEKSDAMKAFLGWCYRNLDQEDIEELRQTDLK